MPLGLSAIPALCAWTRTGNSREFFVCVRTVREVSPSRSDPVVQTAHCDGHRAAGVNGVGARAPRPHRRLSQTRMAQSSLCHSSYYDTFLAKIGLRVVGPN